MLRFKDIIKMGKIPSSLGVPFGEASLLKRGDLLVILPPIW